MANPQACAPGGQAISGGPLPPMKRLSLAKAGSPAQARRQLSEEAVAHRRQWHRILHVLEGEGAGREGDDGALAVRLRVL